MLRGLPVLLLNANIRESFKYCLEDFVCQRGTPTTFAGTFLPPSLIYRRPPILPWVKKRPNRAYNGSKGAKIDSNGLKMFWTKNTCFCQTPGYPLPPFADNVFGKNFWRIWGVPPPPLGSTAGSPIKIGIVVMVSLQSPTQT